MSSNAPTAPKLSTLLAVAGTDPTSGAGVTADLAVFADFGFHGLWVPTAVLDQSTADVLDLAPLPPEAVVTAVERVWRGGEPAAVKLGVLATTEVAAALSELLSRLGSRCPVVLDPVLASGRGTELADGSLVEAIRGLLKRVTVVTPNVPEAEALLGCSIATLDDAQTAASALVEAGAKAVLLKGGHLEGAPGDVWASAESPGSPVVLPNERVFPIDVHGTGCHLSSALAAALAAGATPLKAAVAARTYLSVCLEQSLGRLSGEAAGRPIVVHGEVTRHAAEHALTVARSGPGERR